MNQEEIDKQEEEFLEKSKTKNYRLMGVKINPPIDVDPDDFNFEMVANLEKRKQKKEIKVRNPDNKDGLF